MKSLMWAMAALLLPAVASAQAPPPPEPVRVLLVGSYHFDNPGQDVNNMEVDDVLVPRRQAELERVVASLASFRPTAVAVERIGKAPDYLDPVFADYGPAMLAERRDERVQIGYRTAALARVTRVYAIDEQTDEGEPDYFPYGRVQAFLKARGREGELETLNGAFQRDIAEFARLEPVSSVAELLMRTNSDLFDLSGFYPAMLLIGEGEDQPGPDLLAGWYLRNAKIVNKLAQVTRPGDRVVVVYGAGHLSFLRKMIADAPGFELEPVLPYLDRAR